MIYNSALELIGNTPIIRLNNIDSNIYLKLEKFNIGGSIKDRAVLGMIEDKMKNKEINVGDTIVEATNIINPILDEYDLIDEEYILDISSKERG
jgi:cysteine synthase A